MESNHLMENGAGTDNAQSADRLAGSDDYDNARLEARTWRTMYRGLRNYNDEEMARIDANIPDLMAKQLDYEKHMRQRTEGA